MDKTKKLILTALMAAITCIGTMIIKVPTPTNGYIHPGDGFVLLSGLLLGPIYGSLAAGIGSALSDLISGYFVYVPATFIIKAATALVACLIFSGITKLLAKQKQTAAKDMVALITAGIFGETVMVLGYFIFEIFMLAIANQTSIQAGIISAIAGVIPNIIQAVFGIIIATVLHPILKKLIS
ncbi:MAG: ECF transporter S component [Pseudobutyrivibrio sp.]|nr:ECF transporter S component [Pseudobutyrivibrio sp.]